MKKDGQFHMNSIKVSVIVPVYNVENYLEDCIESVILQKNLEQIELILIDDGSTDRSTEIIKKYVEEYTNIHGYYQSNSGQSAARNNGLQYAQGEYIYFLDSDDMIDENAIDYLYNLAVKDDIELILFEGESFLDQSVKNENIEKINYSRNKEYRSIVEGEKLFTEMMQYKDFYASPCLQFIKKNILKENDINFLEGYIHEDELFSYQVLLSSNRVKCIKDKLFHRRIRIDSTITSLNYAKRIKSLIKIIEATVDYNATLMVDDSNLENALNIRINHLIGQSILYCVETDFKSRKKYHKLLKGLGNYVSKSGYSIYRKYHFYFSHPELYRLLQKTLHTGRSLKSKINVI